MSRVQIRINYTDGMFCFLFREQPHSLQAARLTRRGEDILLKVAYFNEGLNGSGFHSGSRDRGLEKK